MYLFYVIDKIDKILKIKDKFSDVYNFNKSAVEKWGSNVEDFKKYIKNLNAIRKSCVCMYSESASSADLNGTWKDIVLTKFWELYSNVYCAISQVSLEVPGFLKNFPEVESFIRNENVYNIGYLKHNLDNYITKYIENYNRFSRKFDFNFIKSNIDGEIDDRVDDYVCAHIVDLYKNKNLKNYIHENFVWDGILGECDIKEILLDACSLDSEEINSKKDLISFYFENMKYLIPNIDYSKLSPELSKKINQTVLYAEFGTF